MTPSPLTVDTFILTFNAAKNLINVPVFANHIYNAFSNNATSLPELVVISLQEMAPLTKAFVGSYILNPYFQRYETAVNLAAAKFFSTRVGEAAAPTPPTKDLTYRLATVRNVGMTGIMLFARDWTALHDIRTTELGFGAGDMANKGAVGLRFLYTKEEEGEGSTGSRTTELTFVSTHLQAMEWNLETRNKNWATIASRLVFEDPKKYINSSGSTTTTTTTTTKSTSQSPARGTENTGEEGEEAQNLLNNDDNNETNQKALHDISIFKPGSHLFVSGDLNYRISTTSPGSGAVFPSLDPDSPDHYPRFLDQDQLTAERKAGRTLHGLSEAEIRFPPTYKLKIAPTPTKKELERGDGQGDEDGEGEGEGQALQELELQDEDVDWRWAVHRWPGWCDRVLYLDIPWWTKENTTTPSSSKSSPPLMQVTAYDALPAVRTSDHRGVYLRISVPVLEHAELAPSPAAVEAELARSSDDGNSRLVDPRVKLPFSIDAQSWSHRAFVKQWEQALGWSMLISQSRPAIALFAIFLVIGLGTWWFGLPRW